MSNSAGDPDQPSCPPIVVGAPLTPSGNPNRARNPPASLTSRATSSFVCCWRPWPRHAPLASIRPASFDNASRSIRHSEPRGFAISSSWPSSRPFETKLSAAMSSSGHGSTCPGAGLGSDVLSAPLHEGSSPGAGIAKRDRRATMRPFGASVPGADQEAVPATSRPLNSSFQSSARRAATLKSSKRRSNSSNAPTSRSTPPSAIASSFWPDATIRARSASQSSRLSIGSSPRIQMPGRSARSVSLVAAARPSMTSARSTRISRPRCLRCSGDLHRAAVAQFNEVLVRMRDVVAQLYLQRQAVRGGLSERRRQIDDRALERALEDPGRRIGPHADDHAPIGGARDP